MCNESCLIMMAVYNSEKYIEDQLDSIIMQSHSNWHLLIRDDGSEDATVNIISKYIKKDNRIELLINDSQKHGAFSNFHALIREGHKREIYNYYMFSDHDDIWMPDKIERMIKECHQENQADIPVLVYGDMSIVNADGDIIEESVDELLNTSLASRNPLNEFFNSSIHGCNMIMNNMLFQMAPTVSEEGDVDKIIPHDVYYPQFCAIKGAIRFINEPLMLYRRHETNASQQTYSKGLKWIFKKLMSRRVKELPRIHGTGYSVSLYTISQLKKFDLSNQQFKLLCSLEKAIYSGGIYALCFLLSHRISSGRLSRTIGRYWILVTGSYKKYFVRTIVESVAAS